ncbi:hypothetical protein FC83_GL000205 [Agrilactobacillus composti DSM 18527 = JCM 14202]|uniref:HTH cro/C1-type domain-containing protein n=1 Tax=Agrilactobacillus composti DSM 18527 = JCM 14202 TaxID=1423734 RepID=X0PFQ1_9LACO|nr:helix-turn-helix transcriptional regulator [Agrilactobacillus composti]KRM32803.1 hypothetical protein FC83_GL000205 [Agrilactobacillus composti DSM 18527 = JCM 14202]GAF40608.1 transcriptional regulator, XRE family [Agrilactobacillus composti DSM 18527 = JCM 14202]
MALKTQLKKYRQQFGWTQKQLAEKLHVSDKTISSWENGRTYPDVGMLLVLSDVFQISIDQFIRGNDVMVKKIDRDIKVNDLGTKVPSLSLTTKWRGYLDRYL